MCEECYATYKREMAETAAERATGTCDWCAQPATDLRPRRDFEERMGGRLYDVCGTCARRENERLRAEADDW